MRPNRTLDKIRQGERALGCWLQLCNVHAARLLAAQGFFDWLLVDFEHTPLDWNTATNILSSISDVSQGRVTPMARVAVGSIEHIKQALDCGAQGIIAPMVNTAEEAATVVKFSRFPPVGERGGGGLAPHLGFSVNRPKYMVAANERTLVGIQVETVQAVENIEAICAIDGIDMLFIGPNDLHLSLGLPPKFWSDEPGFVHAVRRIKSAAAARNIPLGTLCRDAPNVKLRTADGFTFLGMGSDAHFMLTFAGMEFGDLTGTPEPPETWCNVVGWQSE